MGWVRGRGWLHPLAVGIAAAAFTAWGSWIPSLWGDEAATVLSAKRSLPSLWAMAQHLDAMHASYYLLMHFWIGAFGASAFSLRFPSALAVGAGAAGLVALTRLFGWRGWAATLAGGLFAVLPRVQYAGEEARSFSWAAALVTWTMVAFVAAVQRGRGSRAPWVLYAAGVTVATWLFPYSISVIVITGLVLVVARRWRMLAPWGIASAAAAALSSPILALSFRERGQVAYLADTPLTRAQVLVATWFGNTVFASVAWAIIVIALVAAVWQWRAARLSTARPGAQRPAAPREGVPPRLLLLAWAFLPAVVLVATEPFLHNYAERYLTFCAPAVAAVMADGIRWLTARFRPAGLVAVACVVAVAIPAAFIQRAPYSESGSDWAQLAGYVQAHAQPGEDILFAQTVSPSKRARNALRLYPSAFRGLDDVGLVEPWYRSSTSWHDIAMTIPQAVAKGRVTSARVWVIETSGSGSEGLPELQAKGYHIVAKHHFDLDTVYQLSL